MKEINLRDFYPWYKEDVIIEVTEEAAEEEEEEREEAQTAKETQTT